MERSAIGSGQHWKTIKVFIQLSQQFKRLSFRTALQQAFLEDLAALVDDGVPAKAAIEIISKSSDNVVKEVAEAMQVSISQGKFLADGMYGWFPSYIVELVRAGEEGGALADTLSIAADALTRRQSAFANIIANITYPITVIILGMAVAVFINHSILDNFRTILPLNQWPAVGRDVAEFADFIQYWWWTLALFMIAAAASLGILLRNYVGNFRPVLDAMPIFSAYRKITSARFMQTLGLLITHGVVFKKAIKILQFSATPYIAWHLLSMEYRLGGGKENIAEVLNTGLIEEHDLMRLKIIAHGKGFEHALLRQGKGATIKAEENIKTAAKITGGILLFVGAALALFLILGIYSTGSVIGRY